MLVLMSAISVGLEYTFRIGNEILIHVYKAQDYNILVL